MAKDSKRGGRKYLANLNNSLKPKPQTSASVVSDAPKYRGPTPAAVAAVAKFGSPSAVGFKPAYTPSAPEPDFTPEQLGTWGPFGFKPAEGSQAVMGNLLDRTKPLLAKQIGPILAERLVAAYNKGADKGVERFAYNEMFGNLDPEFFGRNSLSYINLFNPDYEFDTWQKKAQLPIDIAGSVYGGLPLQLGFAYADAKGLSEYAGPGMLGVQTAMTAWNVANNLKQSDFIGAAKAMMPLIKTLGAMGAAHVVYKTTGLNVNGLVDAVQGGALGDIWGTIAGPPPPISGLRGEFVGTPTEPWMPLLPDLADAGGLLARQRAQETATELAAQRFYVQEAIRQGMPETEPALPAPDAALQLEQQRQRTELRFARGIEEALERRRRLEDYETLERRRRYDEAATRNNPDRDLEGSGLEEWYLDVPGRYEDDLPVVRDQAALVDPATLAALDADIRSHFRGIELFERRDQAGINPEREAADAQRVRDQVRQYALRVEYHRDYRGSGPNFFQFPDGLSFEQFRANPPELSHAQLDELEWDLASQRSTYEQHADFYDEPLPLDLPDTPERLRAAILDYETNAPNLGREAADAQRVALQRVRDQEWDEERAGEDEQYDHGALYPEPETAEQWRSVSNSRATADVERFSAKLLAEQEQSQQRFFLGNVNERGISGLGEAQGASWQDYWNAWSANAGSRIRLAARDPGVLPFAEQIASVDAETRKYAIETFLRPEEAARYDQERQNWQEQFDAGNERPQRPYTPEDYGESSVGTLPYPAPQTPVFRSRLVELAEAQSVKKATGEEWLRRLNNKQKVNPGEVLISGIHSVLDPETVYTKEQVLAWLKYTQMTVTATTYQDVHKDIYLRPATYVQQTRLGVTQLPIPDPNRRISPNENYFEIQLNLSREGALLDELPDHVDELAMASNRPVPAHTIEDSFNWNDTVDMTPDVKTELTEKYGHKPEDLVSVDEYGTPRWFEGHGGFEGRNAIGRIGAEGLSVVYNGKRMKVMWVSEFQGATGDENVANTPPFLRFNNHGFKITMKYLMQYAYKNGYDAIAWTNGKTQEELRDADGLLELYDNIIVGSVNDIIKKTKEKVGQVMRPDSPETGWHHIFEIRTPLMEHLINTEGFTISQAPEDKEKQQRAIA